MALDGPIIIIDDDIDDQEIMQEAIRDIGFTNPLVFFGKGTDAITYLLSTSQSPLVIFSDVNLPEQNGLEFKRQIDNDPFLRQKCIPFIFFTTYVDKRAVEIAYRELIIQGFFRKSANYHELKSILKMIIDYWLICKHPNSE